MTVPSVPPAAQGRQPGIYRFSRPERAYDPISRQFSRCGDMPGNAVKLGLYILSHAEGFTLSQAAIARNLHMDEKTVRVAMGELEKRRFLVRHDIRNARGYRVGTAYAITDVPFTDEELETLAGPPGKIPGGKIPGGESPGHKKTSSRRETTTSKKSNPSGGSLRDSDPPPTPTEEDPMPRTAPQSEALPLDLPIESKDKDAWTEIRGRQAGKASAGKSAQTVVAAYVDSYRARHSGGDPLKAHVGRVARDCARMLAAGEAGPDELVEAAKAMGATQYASIGMQVKIRRDKPANRSVGPAPVAAPGAFTAGAERLRQEFYAELREDPEAVRWVMRDLEAVADLLAKEPSLTPYFVAAGYQASAA